MLNISSKALTVDVSPNGAELRSLQDVEGCEYLWQGDPQWWSQRAPLLFPVVGPLHNNEYIWKSRRYTLPVHGFGAMLKFNCVHHSASKIVLLSASNPETYKAYPFEWALQVTYTVSENTLTTVYEVKNTGHEKMFYSIGAHPGFSLAWNQDDALEDYFFMFDNDDILHSGLLTKGGLLSEETEVIACPSGILPFNQDLIRKHAMILLTLRSRQVSLGCSRSPRRLDILLNDFPFLGIWSKPGAPFVCLEPWNGYIDTARHDGQLNKKPGILELAPTASRTFSFAIRLTTEHLSNALTTS
jgi:galactose mutarotase-like enzyme